MQDIGPPRAELDTYDLKELFSHSIISQMMISRKSTNTPPNLRFYPVFFVVPTLMSYSPKVRL